MATFLERQLGVFARKVAPVLFDPQKRLKFTSSDPTSPAVAKAIGRVNQVANEVSLALAQEGQQALRAISEATDQLTDLIGVLPAGEKTKALNQLQEILDLPVFALTEAWVLTLDQVIAANKAVIAREKKRRK